MTLRSIRNLGISAHVDAGKTTLAEHFLFTTGRIHRMGVVRGERPPALDHNKQEQERGITIKAAATTCAWRDATLNIIDTPGHIDFTVEVERTLRALDGAVLVLCAKGGVQAQTRTVERQMARYGVPRIAFINKCDHPGADPAGVMDQLRQRLGLCPVPLQLPFGLGAEHRGVFDLVEPALVRFEEEYGQRVVREPVPDAFVAAVEEARWAMLEALSLHDDALCSDLLMETAIDAVRLKAVVRQLTLNRTIVPVLVGSALQSVGVQPVLDAVVDFLPSPLDRVVHAVDPESETDVAVRADPSGPVCALAFKLDEGAHGQLTWLRLVRGEVLPGTRLVDGRTGATHRVRRLGRLHAGSVVRVDRATAGDVVAAIGLRCASGTTLCSPKSRVVIGAMFTPEPVVECALALASGSSDRLGELLARFVREDPSLRVHTDPESGELRVAGMGELHLEVLCRRLADDHDIVVHLGAPQVTGRVALTRTVSFNHLLRKQNGGVGLYAGLVGTVAPAETWSLDWQVKGGSVPAEYIKAITSGFQDALAHEADAPVIGATVTITDGRTHSDDSKDQAFYLCAREIVRQVLQRGAPVAWTPIVEVEVEAPPQYQGAVIGGLTGRQGRITASRVGQHHAVVVAEVPLEHMFGYAGALRGATSGTGEFAMDFLRYGLVGSSSPT